MKYKNELQPFHKALLRKLLYSILIFVFMLMSVFYFSTFTVLAGISENVGSFGDFVLALANVDSGGEIIITNDFEMTDTVTIPNGKELTIRSVAGNYFTLERAEDFKGSFFSIPDSSTVSFTNIKLDGKGYNASYTMIDNSGTLNLNVGTILTNNRKYAPSYVGGGIHNLGTLKIADGAAISNCFAGSYGGGGVQNEGNMIMTGGMITGNTGEGAVQNAGSGTFTMTGGTITGNMDPYGDAFGAGTGVHHYGSGFDLSGNAKITTNNVNLNDRIISITGALSGSVTVYMPSSAIDGTVIATGDGYTLQESDKAVFSVEGFSLLLENNNIVLHTSGTTIPTEPTQDTQIPVTEGIPDNESDEIHVGESVQTIVPSDLPNKGITWSSSDSGIAEVDENGNVTGIKQGTVTITVTTDDGGHTSTYGITVLEAVTPNTGDDGNALPWLAMGLLSMIASGILLISFSTAFK